MTKTELEDEIEQFRQLVIASRGNSNVEKQSMNCVARLNQFFEKNRRLFSDEDIRLLNVLRGFLGVRLDAHKPTREHTRVPKRKGDQLDHCWRCKTPIDDRFVEYCVACGSREYQWRVCPVCRACGCQAAETVLL